MPTPLTTDWATTASSSLWELKPDLLKVWMDAACGAGGNWLEKKEKGNNAHSSVTHNTFSVANASADSFYPFMENLAHSPL